MLKSRIRRFKVLVFFKVLLLFSIVSFSEKIASSPEDLCRHFVLQHIATITNSLSNSKKIISLKLTHAQKVKRLKAEYALARKSYKQIEFFVEYYSAFDAKFYINGPLVPKNEIELGPKIFEPMGFQVIEESLFDESKTDTAILLRNYNLLNEKFNQLKEYYQTVTIERPNHEEALRLEVVRVMCLTLNGYDCTVNKAAIHECAQTLTGLIKCLNHFTSSATLKQKSDILKIQNHLNLAINYLNKQPNSDKFNRLHFTTEFLNPLYKSVCDLFDQFNSGFSQVNYAINFKVKGPFSIASINKQHFSLYRNDTLYIKQQAALGKLLFFDPILSGNNKRACASCHKPELAFTDGLDKSFTFEGQKKISRNSPTLINALYQKLFFYDGRTFNLEEQAGEVFHNTFEMNSSGTEIVKKLKQSPEYVSMFKSSFNGSMDTSLTFYAVMKSIAEYIKTLESKNSKFDKYIAGDKTQLNKNEINGYNLFSGKALCASCHFYPLFNGLVPPMYNDNEFEVLGTPKDSTNKELDEDIGREATTRSVIHKNAFKTPTLRNINLTAPYMHNGAYHTLDQVLDFYNKGGGAGLKFKIENQTLPFDSLGLTKKELSDIKSFLLALTDTSYTASTPKKLPQFSNADFNSRKIGGEY